MKCAYFAVLLYFCFAVFANANEDNDNWPCYLKKCSRNDLNLSTCLIHHANRALDAIFAGDNKIGIPSFLPFLPGDLTFGRNRTFKTYFHDVKIFGVNNIHVVHMDWNFAKKTIDIKFKFNTAITISGNYVSSGTFGAMNVSGVGHADFIFVGGSQGGNKSYSMQYDLINVLGKDYVQIKDAQCSYQDGFRIEFQDQILSKKESAAHLKILNDHSDKANESIRPEINELICQTINLVLNTIFYNFPLDLIFN